MIFLAGWFNAVQSLLIVSMLGLSLAFIARQALSWRRATGERRQQLKWLATGATVSLVCLALAGTFSSSGNGPALRGVLTGIAWLGVAAVAQFIVSRQSHVEDRRPWSGPHRPGPFP